MVASGSGIATMAVPLRRTELCSRRGVRGRWGVRARTGTAPARTAAASAMVALLCTAVDLARSPTASSMLAIGCPASFSASPAPVVAFFHLSLELISSSRSRRLDPLACTCEQRLIENREYLDRWNAEVWVSGLGRQLKGNFVNVNPLHTDLLCHIDFFNGPKFRFQICRIAEICNSVKINPKIGGF